MKWKMLWLDTCATGDWRLGAVSGADAHGDPCLSTGLTWSARLLLLLIQLITALGETSVQETAASFGTILDITLHPPLSSVMTLCLCLATSLTSTLQVLTFFAANYTQAAPGCSSSLRPGKPRIIFSRCHIGAKRLGMGEMGSIVVNRHAGSLIRPTSVTLIKLPSSISSRRDRSNTEYMKRLHLFA